MEAIETPPIKFDVTEAGLAALAEEVAMTEIRNKADRKVCQANLSKVVKLRTSIEARRKDLKADALEWGRKVDAAAKLLTERVRKIEDPLKELKDQWDAEIERKKREAEEKEKARVDAIKAKIQLMREHADDPFLSVDELKERWDVLEATEVTPEAFEEFAVEADAVLVECRATAKKLYEEAKAQHEQKQKLAAEKAELDRQRAELEKQREEIEQKKAEAAQPDQTEKGDAGPEQPEQKAAAGHPDPERPDDSVYRVVYISDHRADIGRGSESRAATVWIRDHEDPHSEEVEARIVAVVSALNSMEVVQ